MASSGERSHASATSAKSATRPTRDAFAEGVSARAVDHLMTDPSSGGGQGQRRAGFGSLYFESAPAAPGTPRILLISYNFPPDPAVGGLRWQHMSRHFADHGWAVDVVARDFHNVSDLDRARLNQLPAGTRIFSVPDREPLFSRAHKVAWPIMRRFMWRSANSPQLYTLSRPEIHQQRGFRTAVRAYLGWIEIRRGNNWALDAARIATSIARTGDYVAVISSGPPHMAHEGGRLVASRTGLPHVVDMRDPWSLIQRVQEAIGSPLWLRMTSRYERRVVDDAAIVAMNTEASRDAMRAAYPSNAHKIDVIRNGSDDDPIPPTKHDDCFRLRFAGSIYMDRDPSLVFRAAKRVIAELGLTPEQFRIELVGDVSSYGDRDTTVIAREEGVREYVSVGGMLSRQQSMEFLAGATMLLSLPQDSDFAVPAKIYEYLRFDAWMLVMATPQSATALLLRETEADIVGYADVEQIVTVLRKRYEQFASGVRPKAIGRDGRFDRSVQAKKLIGLITAYREAMEPAIAISETPTRV
jgi:hypothetical protein